MFQIPANFRRAQPNTGVRGSRPLPGPFFPAGPHFPTGPLYPPGVASEPGLTGGLHGRGEAASPHPQSRNVRMNCPWFRFSPGGWI